MPGPKPETVLDQVQAASRVRLAPATAAAMAAEIELYAGQTESLRARLAFDDEPAHFARVLVGTAAGRTKG